MPFSRRPHMQAKPCLIAANPPGLKRPRGFTPLMAGLLAATLVACGGGGGSDSDGGSTPAATASGRFLDAAVSGLEYFIDGVKAGTTDADGRFNYTPGQTVSFKLGAVTLGSVSGSDLSVVTPANLAASPAALSNILVLLQSLDADRNPDNGITLDATQVARLTTANDLSAATSSLASVRADLPTLNLVSEASALAHFNAAMTGVSQPTPSAGVSALVDTLVGHWASECVDGYREVGQLEKAGANKLHVAAGIARTYANANCTGSFTEDRFGGTTQSDYFTVVSAYPQADGSLQGSLSWFTTETTPATETLSFVLSPDRNNVVISGPNRTERRARVTGLVLP